MELDLDSPPAPLASLLDSGEENGCVNLSELDALARFGDDYGQAFQAHDDLLGIWGSSERTGKQELNDLTKRKKTLPVVLAFERASPKVRAELATLYGSMPLCPPNSQW